MCASGLRRMGCAHDFDRVRMSRVPYHGRSCLQRRATLVVCLLRIDAWEITLFDSMPLPDRVRQLEPLSRLIPYVIAKGGYFDAKSVAPRFDLMPVVSIPKDDELVQGDVHSCGVFACMYIERMIACDFQQSSSIFDVEEYRGKIALEIFSHSDEVMS
ncbi:hypothetical protein CASFOL_023027 [Castilleja foliolosa]|uniref:Ubiquitin-like protease family profile domain-containing protein n=1 Tax=Castilleja foliolosa TaxID=1961234 RepID=A0ABD3CJE7_9LAMI